MTEKFEELSEALIRLHVRGVTITDAEGAYTHKPKKVLTTVITKFELSETKHTIRTVDPKAFVNITQTMEVMGRFRKD
ncbi:YitT family protein [Bacillus salipaludis]|uniref:YitT family protein n=1 Tax=Bacillus salipaludis TaxID=2547811 RepID=A0ABW8RC31_9BACI